MRSIYLLKALELTAVIYVIALFLSVGHFCGEIDMKGGNHSGSINQTKEVNSGSRGRVSVEHWTAKLNATRYKREVFQMDGEPFENVSSMAENTEIPTTENGEVLADGRFGITTIADVETTTSVNSSTTNQSEAAMKRFEWYAEGCIPVNVSDYFKSSPQNHKEEITWQLLWSIVLVVIHSIIVLFQLYLVYVSHLPPSPLGDFARTLVGFILWYLAFSNLAYVHYNWKNDWIAVNMITVPGFPSRWIMIEVICCLMLFAMVLEVTCHKLLYFNLCIVSETKRDASSDKQEILPTST